MVVYVTVKICNRYSISTTQYTGSRDSNKKYSGGP